MVKVGVRCLRQPGHNIQQSIPFAIEVGERIGGQRVAEILMQLGKERGLPQTIRVDNGPEFTSKRLDQWAYLNGVGVGLLQARETHG